MRGPRFSAVILMSILISAAVNAQVPHENFDDAEINEITALLFIGNTLEDMNRTFLSILGDDHVSALSHSRNLSIKLDKISDTIEEIPPQIDSYGTLNRYLKDLKRAEKNISLMASSFYSLIDSIAVASSFTINEWNLTEVTGVLKEFDDALLSIPGALSGLSTSISFVEENMQLLDSRDLDLSFQIYLANEVGDHLRELDTEWIKAEIVEGPIISDIMLRWGQNLCSFNRDHEVGPGIQDMIDILDTLELGPELGMLIRKYIDDFKRVDGSLNDIKELLSDLWSMKTELEMTSDLKVEGEYVLYRSAIENIGLLEAEIEHQWSVWNNYSRYDRGSVEDNLTILENVIKEIQEWFSSLNLFEDDIQRLSDLASEVLELNLVDPDPDGNGIISYEEGHSVTRPEAALALLQNLTLMESKITEELTGINGDFAKDQIEILKIFNTTITSVVSFTASHSMILDGLKVLTETGPADAEQKYIEAFMEVSGSFLRMGSALETLSGINSSLEEYNVTFEDGSIDHLQLQMELYKDLMLRISIGRNLTGVYLDLDHGTAPYDSEIRARALIVERNLLGDPFFPDGEMVLFKVDDADHSMIPTIEGIADLVISINRTMRIGVHRISLSYRPINGSYVNISKNFNVRKIFTRVLISADKRSVEPKEEFTINITVLDEYGRPVNGYISVNGVNITINGSRVMITALTEFGEQPVEARFPGDEWFHLSSREIFLNVSLDPVLELILQRSSIYQGDPLNVSVRIVYGNGSVYLLMDGDRKSDLSMKGTAEMVNFTINTTGLDLGLHHLQAVILTSVPWARDGFSPRVFFTVIERPVEPEIPIEPADDDDEQPVDDDLDDASDEEGALMKYLRIGGSIVVILLLVAAVGMFIRRGYKNKDRPKLVIPRRHRDQPSMENGEGSKIDADAVQNAFPGMDLDLNRVKVVASYLEVVDRAPKNLEVRRSDTPREAQGKFVRHGADTRTSSDLVRGFEEALYKEGAPSDENVLKVQRSATGIFKWYSTIPTDDLDH